MSVREGKGAGHREQPLGWGMAAPRRPEGSSLAGQRGRPRLSVSYA